MCIVVWCHQKCKHLSKLIFFTISKLVSCFGKCKDDSHLFSNLSLTNSSTSSHIEVIHYDIRCSSDSPFVEAFSLQPLTYGFENHFTYFSLNNWVVSLAGTPTVWLEANYTNLCLVQWLHINIFNVTHMILRGSINISYLNKCWVITFYNLQYLYIYSHSYFWSLPNKSSV